jgi:predicted transcriptional regulator
MLAIRLPAEIESRLEALAAATGRTPPLDDPRCVGEALKGSELAEFWKYRVGDYRIICAIEQGPTAKRGLAQAHLAAGGGGERQGRPAQFRASATRRWRRT